MNPRTSPSLSTPEETAKAVSTPSISHTDIRSSFTSLFSSTTKRNTKKKKTRSLRVEGLEQRQLLAGDTGIEEVPAITSVPATASIGPMTVKSGWSTVQGAMRPIDTTGNFAAQANGASPAIATSTIAGYEAIHDDIFANDAKYGNGSSWISGSPNSTLQINFNATRVINMVQFGRDRLHANNDRDPGQFTVEVLEPNGNKKTVFTSSSVNYSGQTNPLETIRATFPRTNATAVFVTFERAGTAIDELEAFGPDDQTLLAEDIAQANAEKETRAIPALNIAGASSKIPTTNYASAHISDTLIRSTNSSKGAIAVIPLTGVDGSNPIQISATLTTNQQWQSFGQSFRFVSSVNTSDISFYGKGPISVVYSAKDANNQQTENNSVRFGNNYSGAAGELEATIYPDGRIEGTWIVAGSTYVLDYQLQNWTGGDALELEVNSALQSVQNLKVEVLETVEPEMEVQVELNPFEALTLEEKNAFMEVFTEHGTFTSSAAVTALSTHAGVQSFWQRTLGTSTVESVTTWLDKGSDAIQGDINHNIWTQSGAIDVVNGTHLRIVNPPSGGGVTLNNQMNIADGPIEFSANVTLQSYQTYAALVAGNGSVTVWRYSGGNYRMDMYEHNADGSIRKSYIQHFTGADGGSGSLKLEIDGETIKGSFVQGSRVFSLSKPMSGAFDGALTPRTWMTPNTNMHSLSLKQLHESEVCTVKLPTEADILGWLQSEEGEALLAGTKVEEEKIAIEAALAAAERQEALRAITSIPPELWIDTIVGKTVSIVYQSPAKVSTVSIAGIGGNMATSVTIDHPQGTLAQAVRLSTAGIPNGTHTITLRNEYGVLIASLPLTVLNGVAQTAEATSWDAKQYAEELSYWLPNIEGDDFTSLFKAELQRSAVAQSAEYIATEPVHFGELYRRMAGIHHGGTVGITSTIGENMVVVSRLYMTLTEYLQVKRLQRSDIYDENGLMKPGMHTAASMYEGNCIQSYDQMINVAKNLLHQAVQMYAAELDGNIAQRNQLNSSLEQNMNYGYRDVHGRLWNADQLKTEAMRIMYSVDFQSTIRGWQAEVDFLQNSIDVKNQRYAEWLAVKDQYFMEIAILRGEDIRAANTNPPVTVAQALANQKDFEASQAAALNDLQRTYYEQGRDSRSFARAQRLIEGAIAQSNDARIVRLVQVGTSTLVVDAASKRTVATIATDDVIQAGEDIVSVTEANEAEIIAKAEGIIAQSIEKISVPELEAQMKALHPEAYVSPALRTAIIAGKVTEVLSVSFTGPNNEVQVVVTDHTSTPILLDLKVNYSYLVANTETPNLIDFEPLHGSTKATIRSEWTKQNLRFGDSITKTLELNPNVMHNPFSLFLNESNELLKEYELIYLVDEEGAFLGAGHAAIIFGNDIDGWTYMSYGYNRPETEVAFSKHDNLDLKWYPSKEEAKTAQSRYDVFHSWNVNRESILNAFRMGLKYNDKIYRLLNNNCDDVAAEILSAAGIEIDHKVTPNLTYKASFEEADTSGKW